MSLQMVALWRVRPAGFDSRLMVRIAAPIDGERAGQSRIIAGPAGITARGATLLDCIVWAWGLREYQVTGPDALRSQRYDIVAKAGRPATPGEMRPMLRALLAERFGMTEHREKRPCRRSPWSRPKVAQSSA